MFSRPAFPLLAGGQRGVGWKPVPTLRLHSGQASSRLATRPLIFTWPEVGAVTRDRILSRVLLPAPLRPMLALSLAEGMPTTSPCCTSKETSFKAQMISSSVGPRSVRRR